MTRPLTQVVKVGGSLLDSQPLRTRLRAWLDGQPPAHRLLVAGGGQFADLVRQADRRFGFAERTAHWMCIRALQMTAQLLAEVLPETALVDDYHQLQRNLADGRLTVFDTWSFLAVEEPRLPGTCLPEGWAVTSDAIAARLAIVLRADQLILLKSALPMPGATVQQLAQDGYVDRFFGTLASALPPTQAVDLAAPGFPTVELPIGPAS